MSDARDPALAAEVLRRAIDYGETMRLYDRHIPDGRRNERLQEERWAKVQAARVALDRAINDLIAPGGVPRPIVRGQRG